MIEPHVYEDRGDHWIVQEPGGRRLEWRGMHTGPVVLTADEIDALCRQLLNISLQDADTRAAVCLQSAATPSAPALVLHSTAPDKRSFEGELAALAGGGSPYDSTTYAEARGLLLARAGDLLVGRTTPWHDALAGADGDGVRLPGTDHYYLSHALLDLAARRPAALARLVAFLRTKPDAVVRVYALDPAMVVFLLWLMRAAEVGALHVDANHTAVTRTWNRKSILYPTVGAASSLRPAAHWRDTLAAEATLAPLAQNLGAALPTLPGYTVPHDPEAAAFTDRLLAAAALLRTRYGLTRACIKASVGGGGGRITPGVDLTDLASLARLAATTHAYADDLVLEAHVTYARTHLGDRGIDLAPSAHVRAGQVAPGLTLQLTRGTTWVGNIYTDESTADELAIPAEMCRQIHNAMHALVDGFTRIGGLTIGGVDFAIGTVGGVFGDEPVLAAQDPNLSFNGAEALRLHQERIPRTDLHLPHAATLIVRPTANTTLAELRAACRRSDRADALVVVPGRSGMLATHGARPREVGERLFALADELTRAGLLHA